MSGISDAVDGAATSAKNAPSALSKKVGPLPIGAWIGIIAAGVLIAYVINSRTSSGPAQQTLDVAANGTTGNESGTGDGSVGGWMYQQATAAVAAKTYTSNEAWGRAAIQYLIGQGYDAALADVAIRNYLGGKSITAQTRPLITAALAGLGPTPQQMNPIDELPGDTPVTGGGTDPKPQTPPVVKPKPQPTNLFGFLFGLAGSILGNFKFSIGGPVNVGGQNYDVKYNANNNSAGLSVGLGGKTLFDGSVQNPGTAATTTPTPVTTGTTYTTKQGDTLSSIALAQYGSSLQASRIYNANLDKIPNKDYLNTGIVLTIPA